MGSEIVGVLSCDGGLAKRAFGLSHQTEMETDSHNFEFEGLGSEI